MRLVVTYRVGGAFRFLGGIAWTASNIWFCRWHCCCVDVFVLGLDHLSLQERPEDLINRTRFESLFRSLYLVSYMLSGSATSLS